MSESRDVRGKQLKFTKNTLILWGMALHDMGFLYFHVVILQHVSQSQGLKASRPHPHWQLRELPGTVHVAVNGGTAVKPYRPVHTVQFATAICCGSPCTSTGEPLIDGKAYPCAGYFSDKNLVGDQPPPPRHPEKNFGLQIWHPWKKLESGPPPTLRKNLDFRFGILEKSWSPDPPPPPPPHTEKKFGLQIWHPWKKLESRPPPPPPPTLRKNLDFRFGILEKSWSPDPPPPPHPEKKFGLQIWHPWKKLKSRPPPPPPWILKFQLRIGLRKFRLFFGDC